MRRSPMLSNRGGDTAALFFTPTRTSSQKLGWLVTGLLGLASAQFASGAFAQGIPPAIQQIERIQQEQQERTQRQFDLDRESARPPSNLQPVAPAQPQRQRPPSVCRDIAEISLEGALSISPGTQRELTSPYAGQCLDAGKIELLMGTVTAWYINEGMIAARVYLGPQDLSTGRLTLTVEEGKLEKIRVDDKDSDSISTRTAFPGMLGQPLNLRDVEQGLDQINRLLSNDARMSIEPGSEAGASVLVIANEPKKRWRVNLSADNTGSASTGPLQGSVGLSFDNLLGLNDSISFTDRRTLDRKSNTRDSVSDSLSYVIPYGYNTFSVGFSKSSYKTMFSLPGGTRLTSDGDSTTAFVRADRVVFRNRDHLLTLSGTLTHKDSKNYLEKQYLDVSSRQLTVGDLDLSLRSAAFGGVAFLGAGWSQGLNAFGALDDASGLPDTAPRAQFGKARVSASWMRSFPIAPGHSIDLSTSFSGQYSRDVLYGSEQLLLGSVYTVRGFSRYSLSNDNGYFIRNDIGLRNAFSLGGYSGDWRVYAGLDGGYVRGHRGDGDSGSLAGAALGVSVKLGSAMLDTYVMNAVHRPSWMPKEGARVQASLSFSF
ncbi:ShlB/FhaC/HecB family hemolysin secretion/activation protein [Pigmentiphaga aceris]|uniref:ShlB/FhaC/HecB family hemolysin secretion/activation protein n=1 Tax=Pigmentiphaga aceris TaxID=1940612 RepID=A0A5C0ASR2_9BURK|nr:ShlB/FhaC/HecB family hemolysin secretion/activation protein [Pigmentiphaga aceris]QEI05319.1 ShlB/FhaC/HecB family hemolysin secretion/activation protein [Pigmentiphaga aceris]